MHMHMHIHIRCLPRGFDRPRSGQSHWFCSSARCQQKAEAEKAKDKATAEGAAERVETGGD